MDVTYLDNNATTRPAPEVVRAMNEALEQYWENPSSVHRPGQAVRQQIELARNEVCELLGCKDRELLFTSGGTESANLALRSALARDPESKRVLITTKLEHSAVRETAEALGEAGAEVLWLRTDGEGRVDLDHLRELLASRASDIALVSVMWANNETGIIEPITEIGALCHEHGVMFHTDATQWVGKMPVDVSALPIDLLTFAAHKFHGPKGIGGLYIRRGVRIKPLITGGPQERERRGGTENVPGILGLGAAAKLTREWLAGETNRAKQAALRDRFEAGVLQRVPNASINSAGAERLWNTSNIAFPRLEAEAILLLLSERGVCASAGAACSSGSLDPSPVLLAMGIPPETAHGSVRFSLSRETTAEEIDRALDIIPTVIERLRASMTAV